MSFSLDVNILLYASDSSSDIHAEAVDFLDSVWRGNETCYVCWQTLTAYLRMITHPKIFSKPFTQAQAEENISRLLTSPRIMCISEEAGFWDVYQAVSKKIPVRGNLVPDAYLAALLKQRGITTIYTRDRDFIKFPFLKVIDPFS